MPRVVRLYESSRRGLAHNMGGFFGKPKEKKEQVKTVGSEAKSAIERRNEALKNATKEPKPVVKPTPTPTPPVEPKPKSGGRQAMLSIRERREAFERAEEEKRKKK